MRGNENSSGLDKERVDEMTRELGVGRDRTMQRRRLIIYISNEVWGKEFKWNPGLMEYVTYFITFWKVSEKLQVCLGTVFSVMFLTPCQSASTHTKRE